ncbi:hypothetical protein PG993_006028 [Apiospora rasikravindrae]|uniref:Stc1 domain-containing protein n=1 Tax=Apiospora rasikravindrae TaxID=990691 RepID=A0ABR1TAI4_9PEZI
MAKGATYVSKPLAKQHEAHKSAEPIDQPEQPEQTQTTAATNTPFASLLTAERDCRDDRFACWSCLTLKPLFEFEAEQATVARWMDLPGHPEDTLRRVCIECGINSLGLYCSGQVINRKQGTTCWVCNCPRAHEGVDGRSGSESFDRCDDCGMVQPFSTPPTTQNTIALIYKRFATVHDVDAPKPAQVRKTSIAYLLCPASTPVLLSPSYQHSELAGYPEEPEEGFWYPGH